MFVPPRERHVATESVSTPCNCRRDETVCLVAENSDFDGRPVTWKKLRNAIDDAVVELVDDLLTKLSGVDARITSELTHTDVDRLRRRLLRNVRTSLQTSSELEDGSIINAKDKDELQRLRTFVDVLLDCSNDDDICKIANIKKYVMTCPLLQTVGDQRWRRRRHSSNDDSEINVFVLRHGVRIDGLHVSVAGRDDLPVNATRDSREYTRLQVTTGFTVFHFYLTS